ncbi:MAG: DMT family transporter, partial [Arenicella sp.]|nr:DMT family transporter [Arenicella sp.]
MIRRALNIKKLQVPLAFLLVVLIWTATPLAVQWSSGEAPLSSVLLRMLIGVLFCILLMGLMSTGLPCHARARRLYLVSGFAIFSSMSLIYIAAQSIPSGWIAILFGLSPLITGIISAYVEPDTAMTPARLIGVLMGFAGLSLVFRAGLNFDKAALSGISILLCGVIISASSSVLVRHFSRDTELLPTQINVGSLLVALPFFAVSAWLLEFSQPLAFTDRELLSILFLGIVGTG